MDGTLSSAMHFRLIELGNGDKKVTTYILRCVGEFDPLARAVLVSGEFNVSDGRCGDTEGVARRMGSTLNVPSLIPRVKTAFLSGRNNTEGARTSWRDYVQPEGERGDE